MTLTASNYTSSTSSMKTTSSWKWNSVRNLWDTSRKRIRKSSNAHSLKSNVRRSWRDCYKASLTCMTCKMSSIVTWSPKTSWSATMTTFLKWRSSTSALLARATSCRRLPTSWNVELFSINHRNKLVMCSHTPRKQIYGRQVWSCTSSSLGGILCGSQVRVK